MARSFFQEVDSSLKRCQGERQLYSLTNHSIPISVPMIGGRAVWIHRDQFPFLPDYVHCRIARDCSTTGEFT